MVREPAVANQFYPGRAEELVATVDQMLKDAETPVLTGRLVAIQVPHAGYPYSGPTAASAFKLLQARGPVTVVMLGPSHRAFVDKAAVYGKGKWKTPLGTVEIDEALAREIVAADEYIEDDPQAHRAEHSLEVQLPFLQRVLKEFKVVPIMLLEPTWNQCQKLGKAIAQASKDKDVLVLASTDLYHGDSYDDAKATDSATAGLLTQFDPKALYDGLRARKAQACGGDPVVSAMVAAQEMGADRAVILAMTNSNDVVGEKGGYCVGYSATAFMDSDQSGCVGDAPKQEAKAEAEAEAGSADLTEAEQASLLRIARSTLEMHIRESKTPDIKPLTDRLSEKRGAFVTLHKKGQLRGCIGYVEAYKPLFQAVRDMAVAASTEDPRFPPVTEGELEDIDIEITVLSPLKRIDDPEKVEVGKHGLIIRRGGYSGLLLPQVPVEQGWDRQTFIEHTCLKAGLAPDAWKQQGTQFLVFTGQVFGEK
ncbi:MAG: AmmeMemoRadiSam system protein B [candidate division WOR-3 bacterium]|nr:MAG: AmmeMemoRadiSam system protein B [candidate division WOR-3 bacterium]